MSLILSGTNGLSDVDGSAATPAIRGTDVNTGMFFPAADTIAFAEGGVEAMRINSSANVGIGTTNPSYKLDVNGSIQAANNVIVGGTGEYTPSGVTTLIPVYGVGAAMSQSQTTISAAFGSIGFYTGVSSANMLIDSSGNVGVGVSSVIGKFQVQVGDAAPSTSGNMNGVIFSASNVGNGLSFGTADLGGYNWISSGYTNSAQTGRPLRIIPGSNGVQLASGGTSWSSLSDERTKVDLKPIADAAKKVLTLRAVTGRYKTDKDGASRSFLIAQDVQKVLPEAVIVFDDEQQTLGLAYTETIPLLVAAIKEQQAMIEQLKADVAALKGTV